MNNYFSTFVIMLDKLLLNWAKKPKLDYHLPLALASWKSKNEMSGKFDCDVGCHLKL